MIKFLIVPVSGHEIFMSDYNEIAGIRIRSDDAGFAAEEMRECGRCGRRNPPNRPSCLYCGNEFELTGGTEIKIDSRPLEPWENGHNVVAVGLTAEFRADTLHAAIPIIDEGVGERLPDAELPIPVARLRTAAEAGEIQRKLTTIGIDSVTVADLELAPDTPPVRLRSMELGDRGLTVREFNTGRDVDIAAGDLVLIVAGTINESRLESFEKRKRGTAETTAETQTSSDSRVIDIYRRDDMTGYRITTTGFDFSCLALEKSLLAAENIERLAEKLGDLAPAAKLDRSYSAARALLDLVWEETRLGESLGFRRSGFGKKEIARVEKSTNLDQFNKYSRLRRRFI